MLILFFGFKETLPSKNILYTVCLITSKIQTDFILEMFEMIMLSGKKIKSKTGVTVCQLHKMVTGKQSHILCICIYRIHQAVVQVAWQNLHATDDYCCYVPCTLLFSKELHSYHPPYITNTGIYSYSKNLNLDKTRHGLKGWISRIETVSRQQKIHSTIPTSMRD